MPAPREATRTPSINSLCGNRPRDDTEAATWALRAAEQDHVDAQFFLGTMYNAGTGVPQDDYEAVAWFRMAAEAGHPDAQFLLGHSYSVGRGVIQDGVLACMWHIRRIALK